MRAGIVKALHDTIPVMTGYIVLGIGFGVLLSTKGFGVLWALSMSVMIYSGTMQFVAIDMLSAGTGLGTAGLTALMVSARHLFYGITMLERYSKIHGMKKAYMIFSLTDETYSLVCEAHNEDYCFHVSLLDHLYWITGCAAGSLIGQVIKFDARGIDFALTALFVSICVEQWLNSSGHIPAITGLLSGVLCLVIFGADNFLIPSMLVITVMLFALRRRIENV